jgi:hypothetical protein
MIDREKGAHEWMIEFKKAPKCIHTFQNIDDTLQNLNSDYEAKRHNNTTLNLLMCSQKIYFTNG